jgi:hypothetical protein
LLKSDVIRYFSPSADDPRGAKKAITEALGISSGYISQWGDVVPEPQAMRLHLLTRGKERNGVKLIYSANAYKKSAA